MSEPIKTFIIEEHHEAFIVWNYAIQQGLIPPTGNTLFHVDEHSDMGTPRFNWSIHNLNGDLTKIKDFTYKELNIASFIIPSVYRNIFNKVYWIRQKHNVQKKKSVKMYVRSYNQAGKKLILGEINSFKNKIDDPDRKEFGYYLRTIKQIPKKGNIILDIDLDYFSCSGNPNELEEIYVEITKSEYEKFATNNYHRLNYCNSGRIDAITKKDKYYYVFNNYKEVYPCELKVDETTIKNRMDDFIECINAKVARPGIINICRSRHSGYTPKDQWQFIEETLIKKMDRIYDIELQNNVFF